MSSEGSEGQAERIEQLEAEVAKLLGELQRRERLWRQRLDFAARVHRSLLPKPVRHVLIDVDVRYVPADTLSGDYCQVLFPDDDTCYITMCDVTGHGIGPALLATRVSGQVRTLVTRRLRPMEIVEGLNAFILEHFHGTGFEFLTFFAARIDLQQRLLTYSGAGHPSPLLIHAANESIEELPSQNLLIGADEKCLGDHPEDSRLLNPGDRLLFYTDGLTETEGADGRLLGLAGLHRILSGGGRQDVFELAESVVRQVTAFRHGLPRDDMTIVVAQIKGSAP